MIKSLAMLEKQFNFSRLQLIMQAVLAAFAHCCKNGPRAKKRDYREGLCPCNYTQLSHSQPDLPEQNADLTTHLSQPLHAYIPVFLHHFPFLCSSTKEVFLHTLFWTLQMLLIPKTVLKAGAFLSYCHTLSLI